MTTPEAPPAIDPLDHQGLVYRIAFDYRGKGVPLDDLIQEGELGLLRACERFDAGRGFRFSTYASHWIRCFIRAAIIDQAWPIRLPHYQNQALLDGRTPKTPRRRACLAEARRVRATQTAGTCDLAATGASLADLAIDKKDTTTLETIEHVTQIVDGLPDRERTILTLRFGLDGEGPRSRNVIGRRFGVTRERIRQIEMETLGMLRERMGVAI
jgi:RNA polymerase sigma factor (sigma-70 family)